MADSMSVARQVQGSLETSHPCQQGSFQSPMRFCPKDTEANLRSSHWPKMDSLSTRRINACNGLKHIKYIF